MDRGVLGSPRKCSECMMAAFGVAGFDVHDALDQGVRTYRATNETSG